MLRSRSPFRREGCPDIEAGLGGLYLHGRRQRTAEEEAEHERESDANGPCGSGAAGSLPVGGGSSRNRTLRPGACIGRFIAIFSEVHFEEVVQGRIPILQMSGVGRLAPDTVVVYLVAMGALSPQAQLARIHARLRHAAEGMMISAGD